jgi:hypothetical protein
LESATPPEHTDSGKPDLSVIVVTLVDTAHLRHCLRALQEQEGTATFEVIVPCDDTLGDTGELQAEFSTTNFIPLSGRRTYAELRATGANAARGRLLAVTEDHCRPARDWVQNIVNVHEQPPLAIGGVVEKTGPDKALNWAVYFLDYLRYMPPVRAGETHELTDLNVSYKMSALQEIRDVWTQEFHEPSVHAALEARGGTLWLSPDIVVQQRRQLRIGHALWDRYAFGRLFGSTRAASVPVTKRMIYAVLAPVLPALLVVRLTRHILNKKRHLGAFVTALPYIILLASAWAWGEFVGYLTGTSVAALQPQSEHGE